MRLITMRFAGTSCNTDTAGDTPAVNIDAYIITGGTGRFAKAAGTGDVVEGTLTAAEGLSYIHFDGNIDLH